MPPPVNTVGDATRAKEERVLAAAESCFTRYGFRKTTMGDVAAAARISRPALYLVFSSKEEVFRGVVARLFAAMLAEVRQGVAVRSDPLEQLQVAFEVWCVRPYEIVQGSPDAADLLDNSRDLAADAWAAAEAGFEEVVAAVLGPVVDRCDDGGPSAVEVARMLATAVPGLKTSVGSATELRQQIRYLLSLVWDGLEARRR